ncbi:hypothetical protein F2Q69_00046749 [Brassica cretica]|uniref:Uncharacterized protein n=1 Tax=Brassica cretica TaxID=69181 RepID=A0A8S9PYL2_BRACR|nr:hypothetical protein F2Q69_00046749 [Brassica cretica]
MNQEQPTGDGGQQESPTTPIEVVQTPHLDHEGGSEPETQENGQDGTGLSEEGEESVSGSHNQGDQSQGDVEAQSEVQEPSVQEEQDELRELGRAWVSISTGRT